MKVTCLACLFITGLLKLPVISVCLKQGCESNMSCLFVYNRTESHLFCLFA